MENRPIVREGICPPGGWHYPEGNYKVVSKQGTFRDLIQCVMQHRIANGKSVGDPETDVTNYYCRTYPSFCQTPGQTVNTQTQHSPAPHIKQNISPLQRLIDDVTGWATATARSTDDLVLAEEAVKREGVCIRCEYNVPWRHGCSPCVNNADRLLYLIRRGNDTVKHKKLGACALNRHCNRTAVWLARGKTQRRPGTPLGCWI